MAPSSKTKASSQQCEGLSVERCKDSGESDHSPLGVTDQKIHRTIKLGSPKTRGKWDSTWTRTQALRLNRSTAKSLLLSLRSDPRQATFFSARPAAPLAVTLRPYSPELSCAVSLLEHDIPLKLSLQRKNIHNRAYFLQTGVFFLNFHNYFKPGGKRLLHFIYKHFQIFIYKIKISYKKIKTISMS